MIKIYFFLLKINKTDKFTISSMILVALILRIFVIFLYLRSWIINSCSQNFFRVRRKRKKCNYKIDKYLM